MLRRVIPIVCFLVLLLACSGNRRKNNFDSSQRDLPLLKDSGEITAVTLYSSTSFFQYKMDTLGYEYELIQDFARSQNLRLNIKIADDISEMMEMLQSGEADVIAFPVRVNNISQQNILFCGHENFTTQVLVQKANKGDTLITDVTQLIGREVYVQPGTRYAERIRNLNDELGGGILIKELDRDLATVEDLIEMVSRGDIPFTISDDNIARMSRTYFWNIDMSVPVSFMQRSSWVVRSSSPELAAAIDEWSQDTGGKRVYRAAAKRYFELSKQPDEADLSLIAEGHISPYDSLFQKHAPTLGWDWQLLASISYQESRFKTSVVSWAGAEGLMGIMPNTARALGVSPHELKDPNIGVRTGVECLRRFRQGLSEVVDPEEKIKFTLASYNAGIGHIYDARRLAEKYGKDPNVWDNNVAEYIRLKNDPEYYNDPVCSHGYLRGSETYNYVEQVLRRYRVYKSKTN